MGSTPSLEGDGVTGGWCRYPSVSRPGKMETFGQVACSVGRLPIHFMVGTGGTIKKGERWRPSVRSGARRGRRHDQKRGMWRPSVRSRARRGRRHDQDEGTGGTIRMRANIFPTGGKLALIAGNKTEKKKGLTAFKMANPLSLFTSPDQGVSTSFAHSRLARYQSTKRFSP